MYISIYIYICTLKFFFACVILRILQYHDKWYIYIFNVLSINVRKDTDYLDNSCHCIVFCHRSFGSSGLKNPRVFLWPLLCFLCQSSSLYSVDENLCSRWTTSTSTLTFIPPRCKCDMFGFFRKTSLFHWVNNSVFFGIFARDSWIFYS